MPQSSSKFDPIECYAPLLDALPDPTWLARVDQGTFFNAAARLHFGADDDRADWLEYVHTEERCAVETAWDSAREAGLPLNVFCRLPSGGDADYRWFQIRGSLLLPRLPTDEPSRTWLLVASDVHDLHDARARSLVMRKRLHNQAAMLDASIDCIKAISPDGQLIDMNKSGCLALDVSPSSGFGMDWLGLLPEDVHRDGRVALEAARRGKLGRFPGRSELPGQPPQHWDNVLTPVINERNETEIILCLSRDVTLQRELERQLRLANHDLETKVSAGTAELERLWDTSLDLLLVTSLEGAIIRANPAWVGILGHDANEMIGKDVNAFIAEDDRLDGQELLARVAASMRRPVEVRHLHKDGSVRWVEWIAVVYGTEIYATGRHVSAAKEAEEKVRAAEQALSHAQKVEAIGNLTGSVAHDFNNLLSVVRNALNVMQMDGVTPAQHSHCLTLITSTTDKAIALTRRLLDFARRSPFSPSVFSIPERLTDLKDILRMLCGSGIQLDIQISDRRGHVFADPGQFDTMIVNLVANARDAMGGSGRLCINVHSSGFARASWRRRIDQGDFVAVAVSDSGPGVPSDIANRIFEPFFTTKAVGLGTGLGLSQVVGFAEQSGGAVELQTRPGAGATFTVYFPRASA